MNFVNLPHTFKLYGFIFALTLPVTANAGVEDFRFPREASTTKDGYPTPLSGKPITKTPVITKKKGASNKKYPEYYIPSKRSDSRRPDWLTKTKIQK